MATANSNSMTDEYYDQSGHWAQRKMEHYGNGSMETIHIPGVRTIEKFRNLGGALERQTVLEFGTVHQYDYYHNGYTRQYRRTQNGQLAERKEWAKDGELLCHICYDNEFTTSPFRITLLDPFHTMVVHIPSLADSTMYTELEYGLQKNKLSLTGVRLRWGYEVVESVTIGSVVAHMSSTGIPFDRKERMKFCLKYGDCVRLSCEWINYLNTLSDKIVRNKD